MLMLWGCKEKNKQCSGNVEIKQETKKAGGGIKGGRAGWGRIDSSIAKMPAEVRHKKFHSDAASSTSSEHTTVAVA